MTTAVQQDWPQATDLYADADSTAQLKATATDLPSWSLTPTQRCELELLLGGALSPLAGYLGADDCASVAQRGQLASGQVWPWPLSLAISAELGQRLQPGSRLALQDAEGLLVAIVNVDTLWHAADDDPDSVCRIGGAVTGVEAPVHYDFATLRTSAAALRLRLERLGWRRTLAVMTSQPVGPGEQAAITRIAREIESNILILMETGLADAGAVNWYAGVRALERCLPRFAEQTTQAALLPLPAHDGSAAATLLRHVIARNCGATDLLYLDARHANEPGPNDAALEHALGLQVQRPGLMGYDADRGRYVTPDDVTSADAQRHAQPCDAAELLRRLRAGERIPEWLGWPEQVEELARAHRPRQQQGFTLFLTGLSGSGKSTIARALLGRLMAQGSRRVTLLDGDIVRKHLSSELGFSREHRNLNILRIGFVAAEITKHGGVAICAPIAPYASTRAEVREMVEASGGFVEIHVATPLEVCEARDRKGLYAKARAGLIKEFTGISDPYEAPAEPEVSIDTTRTSADEAAQEIILKLAGLGYLQ